MTKKQQLEKLKTQLENDKTLPLWQHAPQIVFGEGNPDADLLFLGEAPGKKEDETGRPFIGAAGKLLDKLFSESGIKREDVYITSIVKLRPPNNRPPTRQEIVAFERSLIEQINIINPKVIITLGRYPMQTFLQNLTITQAHGKIYQVEWQGENMNILPFFHPAAALRKGKFKKFLEEDFKKINALVIA